MIMRDASVFVLAAVLAAAATAGAEDWSGWYAGAFGGYLDGKLTSASSAHLETTGEFDDNSPLAGIHGGFLRHSAGGWVYGAELVVPLHIETGTAVDTLFFPDAEPPVTYEADYRWAVLLGGRLGRSFGALLPYAFGALGLANVDGKTLHVNPEDVYEEGYEQSANATHFVFQLGAGGDYLVSEAWFLGMRAVAFVSDEQSYEMPWNEGENSEFGLEAFLVQVHGSRRF